MMSDFEVVTTKAQTVVYVSRKSASNPDAIAAAMGEAFGMLMGGAGAAGVQFSGPPLSIYHSYDDKETLWDVACPIAPNDAAKFDSRGELKTKVTYNGRALKAVHKGPYANLAQTYGAIMAHMAKEGLEGTGPTLEVYMNDPQTTPEAELLTELYFPLD